MENDEVRSNVASRYRHILVDECQDTDILQVEILFAIAAEQPVSDWRNARLRPGALFLVGDPKQSIYRFRSADIAAYRAARDVVLGQPSGALVEITANFRSRPAIVDFVNANFVDVFDGAGQPAYVALQSTVDHVETAIPSVVRLSIGEADESPGELRAMEAAAVGALCEQIIGRLPIRESNGTLNAGRVSNLHARSTIAILQRLRRRAAVVTPSQLLAEAIEALLVRPILAVRHRNRNARVIANLDALIEMARRYPVFGLVSFVEDLQQQWEQGDTVQEGRSDVVEDAVQIVTMHNCKGLEWPIIIPVGTATNFRGASQFVYQPEHKSLHWVIGGVAPASLDEARLEEERQQAFERQRMWYVAVTRARDLLVVPHLPTSRQNFWFRAVRLDKVELTEVDTGPLPDGVPHAERLAGNDQSAAIFAQQAHLVSLSAPPLKWLQPSRYDPDRIPSSLDVTPSSELTEGREFPSGAGRLRGTVLHKLMEEIIGGDLRADEGELLTRARQLLDQLISQLPDEEVDAPDPGELISTIRSTLANPELAAMLPHLVAEVPLWQDGGATLLAGRADALVIVGHTVAGVIDWKSDVVPPLERKTTYAGQLSDYLAVTGAVAGAIVFMTSGEVTWIGDRQRLLDQLT